MSFLLLLLNQIFKQISASPKAMEELRALVKTETAEKEVVVSEAVNLPKEFKTFKNISQNKQEKGQVLYVQYRQYLQ